MTAPDLAALTKAVTKLDDESYRALVAAADGPTLDALLDGVVVKGNELAPNKTFGKGTRGAKKAALAERLRIVLALGHARSAAARAVTEGVTYLRVVGGATLDATVFDAWPALSVLELREFERVHGLASLGRLRKLWLSTRSADMREIAELRAVAEIGLEVDDPAHVDALASAGLRDLRLVLGPKQSVPRIRADILSIGTQDEGPAVLGPIEGDVRRLDVVNAKVEAIRVGAIAALTELRVSGTDASAIEGLAACPNLREIDVSTAATLSLGFLRGTHVEAVRVAASGITDVSALADIAPTLRRLTIQHRDCADIFAGAPPLGLEHLTLAFAPFSTLEQKHAPWKKVLASNLGLRSLSLRGHALESTFELPPMPELEELDLTNCNGFIELGGLRTSFPKLRRLVLTGTALSKKDAAHVARDGIEVVV